MTTASTHPLVGELVDGRYRVLRHLADGGMATVLLATDTRLDREVALKVMRPDLAADETFVARFRREARSAARLSHPNVVPVLDQGVRQLPVQQAEIRRLIPNPTPPPAPEA